MGAIGALGQGQVKNVIGIALLMARHSINAVTILAALSYIGVSAFWMHAPMPGVLRLTALMALWPLGLAWLCGRIGRRLRENTPLLPPSPTARWLLACAGAIMIGSGAPAALTALRQYECSIDPSRTAAARERQLARDGFQQVCKGDLERYDISFGSLENATRQLAFTPVDLARTPFATLEGLGGKAEFMANVPSRLYRGFRMPGGHRLTLFEHDMSADGSRSPWRKFATFLYCGRKYE